jgi:protein-S-isoprenylcysteine O-methyltransferase Ste14
MPKKTLKQILYRWRVRTGFVCILLAVLISRPTLLSFLLGLGICILGILLRTWASGHLRKEKELTCSGPYRFTRNPLYLANLIIGMSVAVASWTWWVVGIFFIYFLIFYPAVLSREKEKMQAMFPEEYEKFKKEVPFFFPFLGRTCAPNGNRFSKEIYKKNREYRAFFGAVAFWLTLAAKMIIFL